MTDWSIVVCHDKTEMGCRIFIEKNLNESEKPKYLNKQNQPNAEDKIISFITFTTIF